MELEKYYNFSIKPLYLTKFKNLYQDKVMIFKFSIYFLNNYMSLLGMIILNIIYTKKVSLIFYYKGNLGYTPIGTYFYVSTLNFFKFLEKFVLVFLGSKNNLCTNYAVINNLNLNLPLLDEFNDLFEINSLGDILPSSHEFFYFFTFNISKNHFPLMYEFILRLFRVPFIIKNV